MKRDVAAILLTLSASIACAPDIHGDLRTQLTVDDPGGRPRFTYRGVAVGMDERAALAAFGEQDDPMVGGPVLSWSRPADFGTRLTVLQGSGPDHVIGDLALVYEGNPIAIGNVRDRWIAALGLPALKSCDGGACVWDDGEEIIASVRRKRGWTGTDELTVTLRR
jgi:hypothetical protein